MEAIDLRSDLDVCKFKSVLVGMPKRLNVSAELGSQVVNEQHFVWPQTSYYVNLQKQTFAAMKGRAIW